MTGQVSLKIEESREAIFVPFKINCVASITRLKKKEIFQKSLLKRKSSLSPLHRCDINLLTLSSKHSSYLRQKKCLSQQCYYILFIGAQNRPPENDSSQYFFSLFTLQMYKIIRYLVCLKS
jgi:hypothetical protein